EVVLADREVGIRGQELLGQLDVAQAELEAFDLPLQLGEKLLGFRRLRRPLEVLPRRRLGSRIGGRRGRCHGERRQQTESRNSVHAFTPLNIDEALPRDRPWLAREYGV